MGGNEGRQSGMEELSEIKTGKQKSKKSQQRLFMLFGGPAQMKTLSFRPPTPAGVEKKKLWTVR